MMTDTRRLLLLVGFAITFFITGASWAKDRPCSELLDEISAWDNDRPIYKMTLFQAMKPGIKEKVGEAANHREVPRGTVDKIESLHLDLMVQECQQHPEIYSYIASERAFEQTRKAAIEYLEYRKE